MLQATCSDQFLLVTLQLSGPKFNRSAEVKGQIKVTTQADHFLEHQQPFLTRLGAHVFSLPLSKHSDRRQYWNLTFIKFYLLIGWRPKLRPTVLRIISTSYKVRVM